jgi:hypothetical protein
MKLKNILISFVLLYFAASCNFPEKSNTTHDSANGDNAAEMATILSDDDCFDKKMELWFVKFNQLQAEGYNMEAANHEAIASVAVEFKTCNEKPADSMAEGGISN